MDKITNEANALKPIERRLTRNSLLFKNIIRAIQDKKASNIVSLDMKKIDEAVADYFVLCEAQSHVQLKAIADNIIDEIWQICDEKPFHVERGDHWTLVDYVDVVVHIFQPEQRYFYNLEGLWEDAGRVEHNI